MLRLPLAECQLHWHADTLGTEPGAILIRDQRKLVFIVRDGVLRYD
ncbi:MAG: hypothetical protein ACE5HS_11065 [bacterium]